MQSNGKGTWIDVGVDPSAWNSGVQIHVHGLSVRAMPMLSKDKGRNQQRVLSTLPRVFIYRF